MSPSRSCTAPEWIATRTRTPPGTLQGSEPIARWTADAAASAWSGSGKVAAMPSPVCLNTAPPASTIERVTSASCRASSSDITCSCSAHSRVEPTMSVNINETSRSTVGHPTGKPAPGKAFAITPCTAVICAAKKPAGGFGPQVPPKTNVWKPSASSQ